MNNQNNEYFTIVIKEGIKVFLGGFIIGIIMLIISAITSAWN